MRAFPQQIFHYVPTGDGQLTVTSDDPYLSESVDMRLTEHSENVLILTAISHETCALLCDVHLVADDALRFSHVTALLCSAKPIIVETITVLDNLRRVRTVQVS
jgi:hypothetical protein